MFGFDRVKPLQMYVNKLVKKGRLPQELKSSMRDRTWKKIFN